MGKRYNRPDQKAVLHYVTINVRDRRPVFQQNEYALLTLTTLRTACDEHPARLIAYVVMPDHLHAILHPRDGELTRFLSHFKPAVTKAIDEQAAERNDRTLREWLLVGEPSHRELWQDSKHSLHLWSQWMIWQKIHYLHNNPVRKRLVEHAQDYRWSSFYGVYREAGGTPPVPVDEDWWWEK
jgi:REP element-mobilizing transposase RayT